MSIISDALRKAEERMKMGKAKPEEVPPPPPDAQALKADAAGQPLPENPSNGTTAAAPKAQPVKRSLPPLPRPFIIGVAAAIAVICVTLVFVGSFRKPKKEPAKPEPPPASSRMVVTQKPQSSGTNASPTEGRAGAESASSALTPTGASGNAAAQAQSKVQKYQGPPPDLTLNGIMYYSEARYAIINNETLKEGDEIGGAVIVKINRQNVILMFRDLEITLILK